MPVVTKFALIIPALREAKSPEALLPRVCAVLTGQTAPFEILVVDDDSGDGTDAVVRAASEVDARIRLLVRKGERGLSGAILHGWQHTDAETLGVMDADLQHPPELLPRLLEEMSAGADLAIGSRYAPGGTLGGWNPLRRLVSSVAVAATLPVQRGGLCAKDPMSGYFVVRRHCVENINFQKAGFKLLLEILVRGRIGSVREVPFAFGRRYSGISKAGLKVMWDYLLLLARLYAIRLGGKRVVEIAAGN